MRGRPHLISAGRAYVAVALPRSTVGAVEGLQRAVVAAIKRGEHEVEPVPRRALCLPLFDLGVVEPEAFEALELAIDRVAAGHGPFSVGLDEVEALVDRGEAPGAEGPATTVLRLMVDDTKGRLAALRAELGERLARYGFAVSDRPWRPHVPLARVGQAAEVPEGISRRPLGPLRVRQVGAWHARVDARDRWRFVSAVQRPLGEGAASPPQASPAGETIAEALDARLARRAGALSSSPARSVNRARRRRRSPSASP